MSSKLILLRHGQSIWNQKNLFTGWIDIPMSEEGNQECLKAGQKIAEIPIDLVFTSLLIRAQMTVPLALLHHKSGKTPVFVHPDSQESQIYSEEVKKELIPVYAARELNERMYGELQGLNKKETAEKFGEKQVQIWRRSFHGKPPGGESLAMTAARVIPYFQKKIVPPLNQGKNVLIAAHGNSLRAIVMHLEKLSEEAVTELEIATGHPLIYNWPINPRSK